MSFREYARNIQQPDDNEELFPMEGNIQPRDDEIAQAQPNEFFTMDENNQPSGNDIQEISSQHSENFTLNSEGEYVTTDKPLKRERTSDDDEEEDKGEEDDEAEEEEDAEAEEEEDEEEASPSPKKRKTETASKSKNGSKAATTPSSGKSSKPKTIASSTAKEVKEELQLWYHDKNSSYGFRTKHLVLRLTREELGAVSLKGGWDHWRSALEEYAAEGPVAKIQDVRFSCLL